MATDPDNDCPYTADDYDPATDDQSADNTGTASGDATSS